MVSILMGFDYQECQRLLNNYKHAPQILTKEVVATELLQVVWYDRNNSCHKPVVGQCHLMVKSSTDKFP